MATGAVRRGGFDGPRGYVFEITGGNLALDLANTVDVRPTPEARELLRDWNDLVRWSRQAGAVDQRTAARLHREGLHRPEEAAAVLRRTRFLREAIFRLFHAIARGGAVPREDLAALNDAFPLAASRRTLARGPDGFHWVWQHPEGCLDSMLPPVIAAAADLLSTPSLLERVRVCADTARCGWLFLDLTRNRSRRWCDMTVCGNRAKVRRHHARAAAAILRRRERGRG